MFSKQQFAAAREALALLQSANQILIQQHLPALGSGVQESSAGLSTAIAGLKMILSRG
jgi:hypothetical protein